jgi:uncharacterized caspase-like protein
MATSNKNSSLHRKLALIIGNDDYTQPYNKLKQSINNANDVSDLLHRIGFQVTKMCNLSKREMNNSIIDFANKIAKDDLIVFYYSGHGYQVNGENYLLPIDDVNIKTDSDFEDFTVSFELAVTRMVQKKLHYAAIFILDCYRPYSLKSPSTLNCE